MLFSGDNECFRINTVGTYNVIDAAIKMGIKKVIFASSETAYGICFADGERKPDYLPIDEEHPTVPEDSYAMSKVVNEVTAKSFQRRSGIDIYGLRINNVIEPHKYQALFPTYIANPGMRRRNIFSYIDARDLGQMVQKCLDVDGLGYEVFNVSNDDHSVGASSDELIATYYKGIPVRGTRYQQVFIATKRPSASLAFSQNTRGGNCWDKIDGLPELAKCMIVDKLGKQQ